MIQKTEVGDGRLRPMRKSLPAMTALVPPSLTTEPKRSSRRHHFLAEMANRVEGLDVN